MSHKYDRSIPNACSNKFLKKHWTDFLQEKWIKKGIYLKFIFASERNQAK